MQPENETLPPEPHDKKSRWPWGCSLTVLILVLVTSFVVWDLYPILTQAGRLKKLRRIAQPGELWTEIEPEITRNGFTVAPPDLTAALDKDPITAKHIAIYHRMPILLSPAWSLALELDSEELIDYFYRCSTSQFVLITINAEGEIETLSEGFFI